ncbi:malonyl-ACP O-methyltransferase BioC [Parahaliea mediterranea]|uniref:Malonyl-[acyl-carrier protein] O-methyltransferase n=1 Tax=Parahaliea mediterranea TaxID=651086 RepID=A0A939DH00_9GAMM|nr:malonyl-ACP O-methyltransferase BioC [Parahaliea mediterranea]MBN7797878.1 malonyl-ACP O-methyltransferase BioC [Parahaliea mediterranea]
MPPEALASEPPATGRLPAERLLASGEARQELVLLHGWGSSRACWRALLPALRPWANVTLVDLPGLGGAGPPLALDELLAAIVARAPQEAVYVGWSLGGQLAALLAARYPQRVNGLVTLASNPHFAAADGWPGVVPRQLELVREGYIANPERALKRFEALQALQLDGAPAIRHALCACREAGAAGMVRGLNWLSQLDTRQVLAALPVPQLHLLGERDQLVPRGLVPALENLLRERAQAEVCLLPGAGHALPLQAPEAVAAALADFLERSGLRRPVAAAAPARLDKADIAGSFSRAAQTYDSVAKLQRDVGEGLLRRLGRVRGEVRTVLDLGCGTGYFQPALHERFPDARYIGLDLATGMLDYARRERGVEGCWVAGDAEQLPLATDSVDLVFSSLAIQWCQQPAALFAELARVLRPGGACVFSTLGPATLHQLRSAWAAVDAHPHVNEFLPASALERACAGTGSLALTLEREDFCLHYGHVRELFAELKTLGAHNMQRGRPAGLGGRKVLGGMMQAYEQFREAGRLPASYEVLYGHVVKDEQG